MTLLKLIAAISLLTCASAQADFRTEFLQKYPSAADAKIDPAFPGFWSVVKGREVLFVRDDLSVLIQGDVIDLTSNRSLSAALRQANQQKVDVSALPLSDAIKVGSGSRKLYVFSDPDCPFCQRLETELMKVKDTEVYIFPFPLENLHPKARVMAESIWCSKSQADAWRGYVLLGNKPERATCDNPISRNLALGEKLHIEGTPALIFADGTLVPGAIPAERIEAQFAALVTQ